MAACDIDCSLNGRCSRTAGTCSCLFLIFGIVGEELFGGMPGFIGVRRVRSMTFVDFDSIKSATNAMVRYQGHRLEADQRTPGLVIDCARRPAARGGRTRLCGRLATLRARADPPGDDSRACAPPRQTTRPAVASP